MRNPLSIINEEEPWYKDGLSFSCTGCGGCCTGAPGYVWVSYKEMEKIAHFLSMKLEDFTAEYVRKVHDRFSLKERSISYDCIFLDEQKKCKIYAVRPKQCRTYPWWPGFLQSKSDWEEAARFCEGIQAQGPLVSCKEIQEQLAIQEKEDD